MQNPKPCSDDERRQFFGDGQTCVAPTALPQKQRLTTSRRGRASPLWGAGQRWSLRMQRQKQKRREDALRNKSKGNVKSNGVQLGRRFFGAWLSQVAGNIDISYRFFN